MTRSRGIRVVGDPLRRLHVRTTSAAPPDGLDEPCWLWDERQVARDGYARIAVEGTRKVYAHRWAYELLIGPIPVGMEVDHLCRRRSCVNPAHLEPVPPRVNNMRSTSVAATNAAKTACPAGHPLAGDNLLVSSGKRICRACKREAKRRYWARRRGLQ